MGRQSFGEPVEAAKKDSAFRDYTCAPDRVVRNYELNHANQHYDWVLEQKARFSSCNSGLKLSIWEAAEKLNDVVDDSDPDTSLPQIEHLLQTAEAIRAQYPGEEYDWLHLAAFIHDLGKLLAHPDYFRQPQWAVVGDTYPLGCPFDKRIVYYDAFDKNPDKCKPQFAVGSGIYTPGCGLNNMVMAWGHDEYMYQVCLQNKCTLPQEGLYIIRFHSFYAYHQGGAYREYTDDVDARCFPWLVAFQKCDLYSKSDTRMNVEELRPYYQKLIDKYFPPELSW